ncbi:hypothetical protein [Sinorhizobium fredii]|uniref:hypothetical protein n=1 Tax=Rhizobium fredii TaxID=380 RepID=UPI0012FD2D2C|nr:hypothetical protein [Sinorhizobium fredii]
MSERKSQSDHASDVEQAFEEMQHAFEVAVGRLRPALISISKNVPRIRSTIGALQDVYQGAHRGVHQGLVSIGAYMRDHSSAIEFLIDNLLETHRNVENAKLLPENHPHRKLWEEIGHLPLERYVEKRPHLRYIVKPPARPGRRRGVGPVISDETLLPELHVLVTDGKKPTTAAIALLRKRGVPPQLLKSRADHVVKLYKASCPKAQRISQNKKRGKNQPE